ncbi:AMP-binding protein [Variovorax sp. HJSM1_2]|uniref:AMP-binding protein n=1 Tax=Variovorax sp. HJSM1_2 TaxID=3366263 RepID=UPI003BE724C3
MTGTLPPCDDLVHGTLARLAREHPDRIAITENTSAGSTSISFAQLHAAVTQRAGELADHHAPAIVFVDLNGPVTARLTDFLGIASSGRAAAVADPDWAPGLRASMAQALAGPPSDRHSARPDNDFYIGFTSGSTGTPKGFMRDHRSWAESFRVCLQAFGAAAAGRLLAPGGVSHSLFLFGMLLGVWSGAGVVVQPRFSAARALDTLARGDTPSLVAVPSQLVMMIEHARRRALPPMDGVQLVMISGARWMRQRTPELRALFPQARIVEFYGASETSFIAWMEADEHAPANAVGQPFPGVEIDIRQRQGGMADEQSGLIFVRSKMLFSRYVGAEIDPTAALREDAGWLSVRDMGYLDAAGRLRLTGRQNRMIVTAGKNLFPEEIEACLMAHPGVAAASVQGLPDAVRGLQVVAWVQPVATAQAGAHGQATDDVLPGCSAQALATWCRERLEPFKVPRQFHVCQDWPLTPGGKTDHPALMQRLLEEQTLPPPAGMQT